MAVETWKFPLLSKTTHPLFFSAQVRKKLFWDSCFATKSFKIGTLTISRSLPGRRNFGRQTFWTPHASCCCERRRQRLIFREVEDRDLILQARRGDVDAYNVLVSRWERRVFSFIVRSIGDREEALDLSQDTFLKVYRGLRSLQDVERFPQWLFRIAHNETISWRRKKRPEPSEDSELERAAMPSTRRENAAELTAAVKQALGTLPEEQRQAVLLKVYQGFKFHEIAEITGAPVSTVKSRVYSGFEALKAQLAPTRSSA